MNKNISNHDKNKEAQELLINKLQQLGGTDVKPLIKNRRRFVECSVGGEKIIVYYNSKTKGDWQLNLNYSENCDPYEENNKYWILIDIAKHRYYVTPERWLARNMYDEFEEYKIKHGGVRPLNDDSKHHKKSEREIKEWEDAWGIIFERKNPLIYDDEIQQDTVFVEGSVTSVNVNYYERNQTARKACLDLMGNSCVVCGFNFKTVYGVIGDGFIHVHHKIEISSIKESYSVDPKNDLVPVCPNCHAMLHRKKPAYSIEELKDIITNC